MNLTITPRAFTCVCCRESQVSTSRTTKYCPKLQCQVAKRLESNQRKVLTRVSLRLHSK